ncbi:MAG TPA: exo-alpha-sialidase [Candidatus Methanoperedens sp.]|nr:exo-alpha-sialidase [Candidatus Methanoperedens sp.]
MIACTIFPASAALAEWSEPTIIKPGAYGWFADISHDASGKLHAAWMGRSGPWPYTVDIQYSQSADNGLTWSEPAHLSSSPSQFVRAEEPKVMATSDGVVHLAYYRLNYYVYYSEMYYARSTDNGATWSVRTMQTGRAPLMPTITADPRDERNLFMAWQNQRSPATTIEFASSTDGGLTWTAPRVLMAGGFSRFGPVSVQAMTMDADGTLYLSAKTNVSGPYASHMDTLFASTNAGATWNAVAIQPGFTISSVYRLGPEIVLTGSYQGANAFMRKPAGGSFEGPFPIGALDGTLTSMARVGEGAYMAWGFQWSGQHSVRSTDGGITWGEPENMSAGALSKMIAAPSGDVLVIGSFADSPGVIRWEQSSGVDAPEFVSLWEKADFTYSFSVLGTGEVVASFPSPDVAIAPAAEVAVGNVRVPATVTVEDGRVVARFPIDAAEWTTCSIPISLVKGNVNRLQGTGNAIADLATRLEEATGGEDGELIATLAFDLEDLRAGQYTRETQFEVSLVAGGQTAAADATRALIWESATAVYAHLKSNPPNVAGAKLIFLTDDAISVGLWEPLKVEVKITHLTEGQQALVELVGGFQTIEFPEAAATGTHQSSFTLFYPPSFTAGSDTILVRTTVDGVTTEVPILVEVR